ncbi:MAG: hypothetical protein LKM41_10635 [Lachnospiraceae bacterium]|jgi:phosphotriesterase-related protein|nr:hypothetical protein [Lachnospiraceae bacterium]
MMQKIMTVTGAIDSQELGFTSMHEHTLHKNSLLAGTMLKGLPAMVSGIKSYEGGSDIREEKARRNAEKIILPSISIGEVIRSMRLKKGNPAAKLSQEDYYLRELQLYAEHGGKSICDCSPLLPGCPPLNPIRELSVKSGIRIITAAGYYTRTMIPKKDFAGGEAVMQKRIEQMLEEGDPSSGVRCGLVKSAIGTVEHGSISPWEITAVRAAAFAAKHHDVSLHIHTAFPVRIPMVLELADQLENEIRVDPRKVIFCHMDSYDIGSGNPSVQVGPDGYNLRLPTELCRRGFNVGLDTWGIASENPEVRRFFLHARRNMLLELISGGFISQITLGHDMMSVGSGVQNGGSGYLLWPDTLAEMKEKGELQPEDYRTLTISNPARILASEFSG